MDKGLRKSFTSFAGAALAFIFLIVGIGVLPVRAENEIGPGITGGWTLSQAEIIALLDAEGKFYNKLKTARDERIKVSFNAYGWLDVTYIFEDGVLVRVKKHEQNIAETRFDFLAQQTAWEKSLTAVWNDLAVIDTEVEISDDVLGFRQAVYTDGRRYVAASICWQVNGDVVIDALYFNPERDGGETLWRQCLESGYFFIRDPNIPESAVSEN